MIQALFSGTPIHVSFGTERQVMRIAPICFSIMILAASMTAQSKPSSDSNSRYDCPQWKIDMVYSWSEQSVADEGDPLRQLQRKELEQRKNYAHACIISIARARDPKKELVDDDPHNRISGRG